MITHAHHVLLSSSVKIWCFDLRIFFKIWTVIHIYVNIFGISVLSHILFFLLIFYMVGLKIVWTWSVMCSGCACCWCFTDLSQLEWVLVVKPSGPICLSCVYFLNCEDKIKIVQMWNANRILQPAWMYFKLHTNFSMFKVKQVNRSIKMWNTVTVMLLLLMEAIIEEKMNISCCTVWRILDWCVSAYHNQHLLQ